MKRNSMRVKLDTEKLKLIMLDKGLSVRDIADMTGRNTQTIYGYFNDGNKRISTVKRLADALGVRPGDLIK